MPKSNKSLNQSPNRLHCYGGIFDFDAAQKRLDELNQQAESPTLWDNPTEAQALLKERDTTNASIQRILKFEQSVTDNTELLEL